MSNSVNVTVKPGTQFIEAVIRVNSIATGELVDCEVADKEENPALFYAINRIADLELELERETCRFYHADGSFETLESPEAAKEKRIEAAQQIDRNNGCPAAIAAMKYAAAPLTDEPESFLRCWLHGEFDVIRKEWPDAPEAVFQGVEITGGSS